MQSVHITTKGVSLNPAWLGVLDTTLCDKVYQWLAAGLWFSPGTLVSFINKTNSHDIAEILLKLALNTKSLTLKHHSTNVGFLITGTMLEGILRKENHYNKNKMNCELMLTYDTPALRQTGSRNLTGQKTLPTIWGTYKKLVTKYQISAINSCWEKCD
jgi:hypothetical protein